MTTKNAFEDQRDSHFRNGDTGKGAEIRLSPPHAVACYLLRTAVMVFLLEYHPSIRCRSK